MMMRLMWEGALKCLFRLARREIDPILGLIVLAILDEDGDSKGLPSRRGTPITPRLVYRLFFKSLRCLRFFFKSLRPVRSHSNK